MTNQTIKPVIVLAFANDRDDYLRNLAEEARCLREEALKLVARKGLCEIVVRPNATVREILDIFQDEQYRNRVAVFHYGGHANSYQLLFEGEAGQSVPADAAGFAAFLGHQTGLQLVFLNGCSTQRQAQGLLDAGVAVVVGTDQDIDDRAATEFAARFYKGLAGGATIRTAFGEAQAALRTTGSGLWRALGEPADESRAADDRLPWELFTRRGAEAALDWNLPEAANNPLYSLPDPPRLDLPPTPYRRLEWFRREDAEIFFGRGREIAGLYRRVTALEGDPIILFYGQSGVGKSSVLAAGLLPRLEHEHEVRYIRREQATGLAGSLRQVLTSPPAALRPAEASAAVSSALLGEDHERDFASAWVNREAETHRPLTIILDQVEELFTRPNREQPDEMDRFLDILAGLMADPKRRPQGRLILGFRKEWLAEIEKRLAERRLPRAKIFLERLSREGIVEVVMGPADERRLRDQYGLTVKDELPGLIADDLLADPESPVAPMLQILLAGMWEAAKARDHDHPTFDKGLYDEFQKRGLGLNDFLTRQMDALRGKHESAVESGLALDLLAYHTTPLGTAEQRTWVDLEQTYRHQGVALPGLVQACCDLYLMVSPSQNPSSQHAGSRLTHDTLAPHVRKLFDESDAPGQRARRILESRAVDWEEGAQGAPLDDADLKLVEDGQPGMRAWSPTEARIVEASRVDRAKRRRRSGMLRGLLVGAAVFILIMAGVAWWQRGMAERQAHRAKAGELAALSGTMLEQWPLRSLLLAVESLRSAERAGNTYSPAEEQALRDVLQRTGGRPLASDLGSVNAVTVSPDGDWLVTGGQDGAAYLWSLRDLASPPVRLDDHQGPIRVVAITPDGSWAATGGDDGIARLWRIQEPQLPPARLQAHQGPINALAASNDGRWLVTAGEDGIAYRWALADLSALPAPLKGHENAINDLAISNDSRWLVTGGWDGRVRLWDLNEPSAAPRVLHGHDAAVRAVAISPDGKWLVSGADPPFDTVFLSTLAPDETGPVADGTLLPGGLLGIRDVTFTADSRKVVAAGGSLEDHVYLWDLEKLDAGPILLAGHTAPIRRILPAGDRWLVTVSDDKTARLWPLDNLQEDPTVLRGHEAGIVAAAADSDGKQLVTADADGNVRLWTPEASSAAPVTLADQTGAVTSVALSDDGQWLATAGTDRRVAVRRLADPLAGATVLPSDGKVVRALAFTPDSRSLITAGDDDLIRQWALDDLSRPRRVMEGHSDPVYFVTLSGDGQWLATASQDNTVRVWNLANAELPSRKLADHGVDPYALAMSGDGRWVASGDRLGTVLVKDTLGEAPTRQRLERHQEQVEAVGFSPDGRWLATAADDGLILWRLGPEGIFQESLAQLTGGFNDAAFSPEGRWLAAAGANSRLWLWDLRDLAARPVQLSGHARSLQRVAFTSNGARIVSAGDDGAVLLWQVADLLAQPIRLAAHRDRITAMDAGGRWLLTGDNAGMVYLWSLDLDLLKTLACRVAGGNLSVQEQRDFLGSVSGDQVTCPGLPARGSLEVDLRTAPPAATTETASSELTTSDRTPGALATAPTSEAAASAAAAIGVVTASARAGTLDEYAKLYLSRAREGDESINDAVPYGVRIADADVAEGQAYWRVIGVHHLMPEENRGGHNLYLEALDEAGQSLRGSEVRVGWTWEGNEQGEALTVALDRPAVLPGGVIPINMRQVLTAWVAGVGPNAQEPSERVENIHAMHPDESGPSGELWNSTGHHSFYVVFQRTRKTSNTATRFGATAAPATPVPSVTGAPTATAGPAHASPAARAAASPTPAPQTRATSDWRESLPWGLAGYVERYLARASEGGKAINDAADLFGVGIVESGVAEGESYWKVIGVHRLLSGEDMLSHDVTFLLLDSDGKAVQGPMWLQWGWAEGGGAEQTSAEPLEGGVGRLKLFPGAEHSVNVVGTDPSRPEKSDRVEYLRTDHPRSGPTAGLPDDVTRPQSFFVVMKRVQKAAPATAKLAITEIMYDPPPDPEFIEVTNLGAAPVNLSGASFSGIGFTFADGATIRPDESVVVVRDAAAFAARHPGVPATGVFTGKLANEGERITLRRADGEVLASAHYGVSGDWPDSGDRRGSLVLADPEGDPDDPKSWRLSTEATGSPGKYPD